MQTCYWDNETKTTKTRPCTAEEILQIEKDRAEYSKPVVPDVVSIRQAMLALAMADKLKFVQPTIDVMPEPQRTLANIEWQKAIEVKRNHPLVLIMMQEHGWSEEEIDELFLQASTL